MDALKRAGIVVSLPFAGLCALTGTAVGASCFVAGLPFVAVYSGVKYVVTGKCADVDKYFDNTFRVITYGIGSAPLYFLVKHMNPKTSVDVPKDPEELKTVAPTSSNE